MAETLNATEPVSIDRAAADLQRVREEIGRAIIAQDEVIEGVLICLVAGGHVLLEGVPGLGKTTLLRTLSAGTRSAVFAHPVHTRSHARRHRGQRHHGR